MATNGSKTYLTAEGLRKVKEELEFLTTTRRREVAQMIAEAKAEGDISENAGYDEAKTAQGFLEGRIRELENVIDSLIALNCSDVVQLEELPIHVQRCEPHDLRRVDPGFGRASMSSDEIPSVPARRGKPDRRRIRDALERFGGDKAKAAKFLGISRATLYRRLSEPS